MDSNETSAAPDVAAKRITLGLRLEGLVVAVGEHDRRILLEVLGREDVRIGGDIGIKAVLDANEEIYQYALGNLNGLSTGTTLTAGLLHKGRLTIAHIGDSRLYLIRKGLIEKLTRDHSFVGELVEKGILDPEEARKHPLRNQITRALGYEKQVQIDFFEMDVQKDDIFLFCTDGLTLKMTSDELLSMLSTEKDLNEILKNMVALANERGGEDNITAIAVKM
jgi:protein phosphatase